MNAQATRAGGRHEADLRWAFCGQERPDQSKPREYVGAPLFEAAAAHDGQPPADWLRVFLRTWESEAA